MKSSLSYSGWKEEYNSMLENLSTKRILMFFSGGKDSSFLLDYLLRAGEEFDFSFETHAGAFPIHRYPAPERKRIDAYWETRGINILWHEFPETDEQIRNAENPCLFCQRIRKKLLKKIVAKEGDLEKLVMVISYSLWDLVSYSIEHILTDLFTKNARTEEGEMSKRFIETAQRFYPILTMKEGYSVFRPLVRYDSRTIRRSIKDSGMPILSIPCEFRDYRPKRILEKYYEKMDLNFDYDNVFHFAKEALKLPGISKYTSIDKDSYLMDVF